MHTQQWTLLSVFLLLALMTVSFVRVDGHKPNGHHGHGGHGNGGQSGSQCQDAQQFFNQWWPQSVLGIAFQTVCRQVGVTQAWTFLQSSLGVSATGALDQTTFQALLNNANQVLLAQQLLTAAGNLTTGK